MPSVVLASVEIAAGTQKVLSFAGVIAVDWSFRSLPKFVLEISGDGVGVLLCSQTAILADRPPTFTTALSLPGSFNTASRGMFLTGYCNLIYCEATDVFAGTLDLKGNKLNTTKLMVAMLQ